MNKAELVQEIQKRLGGETSRAAAERVLAAVLGAITSGIKRDKQVQLVGFGAFTVTRRAARRGYDPHRKTPMTIKAMKTVRFKSGTELKAAL